MILKRNGAIFFHIWTPKWEAPSSWFSCILPWNGVVVVQWLTCVPFFVSPWTVACQAPLSSLFPRMLKFRSTESMTLSNHLILCCPLFLLSSIFPSIQVFSSKSALHVKWPKDWSFNFSIRTSNDYSVLISFRIGWFDLLAVQETLKSLIQHHS